MSVTPQPTRVFIYITYKIFFLNLQIKNDGRTIILSIENPDGPEGALKFYFNRVYLSYLVHAHTLKMFAFPRNASSFHGL